MSGPGIDAVVSWRQGTSETRTNEDLEKQGDEVNGEQVRVAVENKKFNEGIKAGMAGLAFCMATVGLWGDGA